MSAADASIPDFSGCLYGSVDDPTGQIYDSRSTKRGSAIADYAAEYGHGFTEVKCRVIYARWIPRDEVWTEHGADERWLDNWMEDHGSWTHPTIGGRMAARWQLAPEFADQCAVTLDDKGEPQMPPEPPEDWEPGEDDSAWERADKSCPDAVKVYLCEGPE